MSTDKNNKADKAYYYFYAGLNKEHQQVLDNVKTKMTQETGSAPGNLDMMLTLMRTYLGQSTP